MQPPPFVPQSVIRTNHNLIRKWVPTTMLREFHFTPSTPQNIETIKAVIFVPAGGGPRFLEIYGDANIQTLLYLHQKAFNALLGLLRFHGPYKYFDKKPKNRENVLQETIDEFFRNFEGHWRQITLEHEESENHRQVAANCIVQQSYIKTPTTVPEGVFEQTFLEALKAFKIKQ